MIDFAFIAELEGSKRQGYVPNPEDSNSGVTIGCGFDLGQRSAQEIRNAFDIELANKLLPYVGLKRYRAVEKVEERPLTITSAQEIIINEFCHAQAKSRITSAWNEQSELCRFDELSDICQTVIASVAFQYGNLKTKTPNFWRQVTAGDWSAALANLRAFGDDYPTRRNKEANLLATFVENL